MSNEWRDATSYSRDQAKEDRKPNVWEKRVGSYRFVIVRSKYEDEGWYMRMVGPLKVDKVSLISTNLSSAKAEILPVVDRLIRDLQHAFDEELGLDE